jgi:hypothetical protein
MLVFAMAVEFRVKIVLRNNLRHSDLNIVVERLGL